MPKGSLSIFTGKFDKNKEPIFASLPNTNGGDVLIGQLDDISKGKKWEIIPYFNVPEMSFYHQRIDENIKLPFQHHVFKNNFEIISTQYTPKV